MQKVLVILLSVAQRLILSFQLQLLFCLQRYQGDEKIKTFIWDLIKPCGSGEESMIARNHSGLHNLVPRGRNAKGTFLIGISFPFKLIDSSHAQVVKAKQVWQVYPKNRAALALRHRELHPQHRALSVFWMIIIGARTTNTTPTRISI